MQSPVVSSTQWPDIRARRISVLLVGNQRDTRPVADVLAHQLRAHDLVAGIADAPARAGVGDALVIGASATRGGLAALARFVASARAELAATTTALFVVRQHHARDGMVEIGDLVAKLDWRPSLVAALELEEPHWGSLVRWVVRRLSPRREWVVTSSTDAVRFADAIATALPVPQRPRPPTRRPLSRRRLGRRYRAR